MTVALDYCTIQSLADAITMEAEIKASGVTTLELCKDGVPVIFQVCKLEDKTIEYTPSDGSGVITGSIVDVVAAGYGSCQAAKERFIDRTQCFIYENDDVKLLNPIDMIRYFDCESNTYVYFQNGVDPTESNIFNVENFNTMSDKLRERGRLVEESAVVVTPYPAHELTICVDAATDADVIADIEATPAHAALIAALPVPPTGAAYGISSLKLRKIEGQKGMTVRCDKTEADAPLGTDANTIGSFVTPFDSGTEILPDGESDLINRPATAFTYTDPTDPTVCKPAYEDGSQLVAGDVTFTNGTAAGAYAVDYCIGCYAVNPNAAKREASKEA